MHHEHAEILMRLSLGQHHMRKNMAAPFYFWPRAYVFVSPGLPDPEAAPEVWSMYARRGMGSAACYRSS